MKGDNIHSLFEEQAANSPRAVAIQIEDETLTYSELNQKANQLARFLSRSGIEPGHRVGLFMESSLEVIVGILGILKAGATYVPINPLFPTKRTEDILNDTRVSLVLTLQKLKQQIPASYDGNRLVLDAAERPWETEDGSNLGRDVSPESVAYIAYTSGSTGFPKGVLVKHGGAANFLRFLARTYPITSSDVTLQIIPFYFNGSVREVFGTLVCGARLVMIRQDKVNNAAAMIAVMNALEKHGITIFLSMVPAVLKYLVKMSRMADRRFEKIRLVLSAGETIHYNTVADIKRTFSDDTVVISQYGQTESSGVATYFRVGELEDPSEKVPIGKAIDSVYIYVLNEELQRVSDGVPGNIYIGGAGVAKGYLNQPEATAAAFVPDPFRPGDVILKTGDIGKIRPDGNLEFIGRSDDMVIVGGYRIELAEIERTLERYSGVQAAAVSVLEDDFSNKYLNCYYIPREAGACSTDELLTYAKGTLPEYMIPSAFIKVDAFPLKPNGKLDRRALLEL